MSRQGYPKQLLALLNDHSLLQNTVLRLNGLHGLAAPILVCNEAHRYLVQSQMAEIGYPDVRLILEPVGRNTAPAISLAALAAQEVDPEATAPCAALRSCDYEVGCFAFRDSSRD